MDSSSTSSMAAANNRDSPDDDGPISFTNALAKDAALQFQLRKFPECLEILHQLLRIKPDDPKILHNIAIVENFQDGFSNPKRFLEVLNSLKRRSEELARASGEHVEAASNTVSKATIGTKGSNSVANQVSPMSSTPSVYDDEFDVSVTMFNIAATWYNLHEYEKSFSLLEPLYQNIEPIDERVAYQVCLLLLDVSLICSHASRAADVISYMERVFVGNALVSQGDNGSFTQQQSTNLVSNSSSLPNNAIVSDDSTASANGLESPLSGNLSEDTLYDSFMSTFGSSGQNLSRPSNDRPRDESFITSDKLHLYKIWLLLLARNLKAAKREVKMAMNVARGKDYSLALFLKSQLEYARGNHRKAIKLLMASSNRTETGTSSMYYNNLGCIYYQLGKYHTSTIFFSKALNTNSSLQKEKPLKLLTFAQDKSLLIVYNCGVTYLATGKPALAARCFREASSVFYKRPLLWLRIAECCLMALEQKSEINVHVIGRGKWRQLVIENGVSRNEQVEFVGKENIFSSDDRRQFKLSMSFARNCLSNALHLLNCSNSKSDSLSNSASEENESRETTSKGTNPKASNLTVSPGQVNSNGEVKEQKVGNSLNASLQSSISEYEGICGKQSQTIKQAVLADLAFVELELGNPLKALSTARSLLRIPECSRIYIFLGNLYAAEALCLLNRLKEASEHLYVYVSSENNVELPYSQEDWQQWQSEKPLDCEEPNGGGLGGNATLRDESQGVAFLNPDEARATLWAELAVMSAFQGDIEKAHKLVEQALLVIPNKSEVVLTAIYVDLVCGNTQGAIARLKQCTRVRFLPSNLTSKGSS